MTVIANTTIISNFAAVGQLDLLRTCWSAVHIPERVYDEIQNGLLQGYEFYAGIDRWVYPFSNNGWLRLTTITSPKEVQLFGKLLASLHPGEAACLSIAHYRRWAFLSDDKEARRAGAGLGVPISGTLGVLLSLVRRQVLAPAKADIILHRMVVNGYFSPVTSLKQILQYSGE